MNDVAAGVRQGRLWEDRGSVVSFGICHLSEGDELAELRGSPAGSGTQIPVASGDWSPLPLPKAQRGAGKGWNATAHGVPRSPHALGVAGAGIFPGRGLRWGRMEVGKAEATQLRGSAPAGALPVPTHTFPLFN